MNKIKQCNTNPRKINLPRTDLTPYNLIHIDVWGAVAAAVLPLGAVSALPRKTTAAAPPVRPLLAL